MQHAKERRLRWAGLAGRGGDCASVAKKRSNSTRETPKPLGFKYVIKCSSGCGTCMCLSFNAVLMYFGHHSVVVMAFAALCSWVSYILSDPAMDQLTESVTRLERSIESNTATLHRHILVLEERINSRFNNLHVSLGTAPGNPPGIDEDVMAALDKRAHLHRDDSELRERVTAALTEDKI